MFAKRLGLFSAAMALSIAVAGQAPARMPRVVVLQNGTPTSGGHLDAAFKAGLAELGYVPGRNLKLDVRYAEGRLDRLPALAKDVVDLKPDVIFVPSALAADAARKTGTPTPIVFALAPDPVADGFAATLARPGGNMTGLTSQSPELGPKRVQMLREINPRLSRMALMYNLSFPGVALEMPQMESAARAAGIEVLRLEPGRPEEFEAAFEEASRWKAQALMVVENPMFFTARRKIVELADRHRIPAVYRSREYVDAGGLISYGADYTDLCRRAAVHVDKILKGARPGELPIEQPVKFELVINAKTARSLGLKLPQPLLMRADQVVE